jgi:formamidopyrimidine-DNA glycosylase
MPELPEVETVCRGLATVLEGRRIARLELRRPDLRFPLPPGLADKIEGRVVTSVRRRAKFILITLDDGGVLIGHLGMSGRMVIGESQKKDLGPHDHVIFTTDRGISICYNDARRFGFFDYARIETLGSHPMLVGLGPEPLSNAFSGPVLAAGLKGRKSPIKAVLLDQRVVAGLGNIYVSESLYWAGIDPMRQAASLSGAEADRLATSVREVLTRAVAAGGSSLRDYVQTSGELGYFQHQWAVYGKEGEPCPNCDCGGVIRRIVQSNRSTFYCPARQK